MPEEVLRVQPFPSLVTELIYGRTLEAERNHKSFELNEVQELAGQLLAGLHHIHENHITHRGIKPDNIMVMARRPLQIKIMDFGVAAQQATNIKSAYGEHSRLVPPSSSIDRIYQAPEIFTEEYHSNKVDIWSVGVMLLDLIVGVPSCHDLRTYKARTRRLHQELAIAQDDAAYACRLIRSLLQHEPSKRPSASQAIQDPFLFINLNDIGAKQYWYLTLEHHTIKYMPNTQSINITQLLAAKGRLSTLRRATRKLEDIKRTVVKQSRDEDGEYVTVPDAFRILECVGARPNEFQHIIGDIEGLALRNADRNPPREQD